MILVVTVMDFGMMLKSSCVLGIVATCSTNPIAHTLGIIVAQSTNLVVCVVCLSEEVTFMLASIM
jgi:hypothetical protein